MIRIREVCDANIFLEEFHPQQSNGLIACGHRYLSIWRVGISGWVAEVASGAIYKCCCLSLILPRTYFPPLMPYQGTASGAPSSSSVMYQHSCWDRKLWRPETCNGQIHLEAKIGWLVLRSFIVNPNLVSRNCN